jgi:diguanylate cyclase (GGDEF)-like protein
MHLGLLQEALASGERALPVLQRFHDRPAERSLHHNLAVAHIKLHQFDAARRELARAAALPRDPAVLVPRARELRELGDSWAEAGQHREALAAFHGERELSERANERSRAAALEELRRKYDTVARQRDLDLLARDGQLKDQQLENGRLAQQVGLAVGALLLLSMALIGVTLLRMRRAQASLTANQSLLRAQSERDPLTDLSNRRHFLAVMDLRARQTGAEGFRGALMMIDIDHFKNVNDRLGHAVGDRVLKACCLRWERLLREQDVLGRLGGEEFCVLLTETPPGEAWVVAERLRTAVSSGALTDGVRVTVSIGLAAVEPGDDVWADTLERADQALYAAKHAGRNRLVQAESPTP